MNTNTAPKSAPIFTHEGAPAVRINALQSLRRSVLATLLWEDTFYETGVSIADRIKAAAANCNAEDVAALAIEARRVHGLRHAPLLLLLDLVKRQGPRAGATIAATIKRVDEMAELVNLYWADKSNKRMLPRQMKRGLAGALKRFDEYQLAKYDREGAVRLRDVLFLIHAKPEGDEQVALYKRITERSLAVPDTWEVGLSTGGDKKETFTRLLTEGKLGYLAVLRNLRNMTEAGIDMALIKEAILARKGADLVFPFRYVSAARAVPQLSPTLDQALMAAVSNAKPLAGRTVIAIDTSSSMEAKLSGKSELSRIDAAATLGAVINGDVRAIIFGSSAVEVPPYRGLAGVSEVTHSIGRVGHGTDVDAAVALANRMSPDRLIVITDEQSATQPRATTAKHAYMINVASNKNGIGYPSNGWTHLDGFSEAVIRYMAAIEAEGEAAY